MEKHKIDLDEFSSLQNKLFDQVVEETVKKLEDLIIEGLRLKGHVFETREELENFVKLNCSCFENSTTEERTYYLGNTPFLLYIQNIKALSVDSNNIKVNLGKYKFL